MTTVPGTTHRFAEAYVRALSTADAAHYSAFAERLFRETYVEGYDPADIDDYVSKSFSPAQQTAELMEPGGRVLAIEDSQHGLLGFAHLRQTPPPPALDGRFAVEISRFYVDRPWHGRGIARVLMSACIAEARSRGADALWLLVYQDNPRAVAFYEKSGFTRAGTQPFYLGRRVDQDWLMVRVIAGT
ncbi:MAG TPA: GNAT family N-acetyltransferase [Gemmatimonadaceae bacterium]|nr:GNAT family N-acetyltransferase [Gemmatimonadaceae bacterium]